MPTTATSDPMTRVDPDHPTETWAADTTRTVHAHLARTAGPTRLVDVSHREAAAALGVSPATVRRAVHTLLEDGALVLVRRGTGGRHRSRYRLTAPH